MGAFGYFPSGTLGAMNAAQYFATLRQVVPDLDQRVAAGDHAPVFTWFEQNIGSPASRWETDEVIKRATGEPLTAAHFDRHVRLRYLGAA
ncbi:MAG: hypothetical protein KBG15_15205 [Kofleriaceae bacterium]|nr:hypothetical protein [Kofleriaceae bacterium]